jgi:hypothetical protein
MEKESRFFLDEKGNMHVKDENECFVTYKMACIIHNAFFAITQKQNKCVRAMQKIMEDTMEKVEKLLHEESKQ